MGFPEARVLQTPEWLLGPQGEAYQRGFGKAQDEETELLKGAAKAGLPYPLGPLDGSGPQGQDRLILLAPGEAPEDYAARLTLAHELWYWAGTKSGLANIFHPFAPAGMSTLPRSNEIRYDRATQSDVIHVRTDRGDVQPEVFHGHVPGTSTFAYVYDYASLGGPWWVGGDPTAPWWSKFVIEIDSRSGPWSTLGTWGDLEDEGTTWGDLDANDYLWGSTITSRDLAYMRRMVRRWKPIGSYPLHIAVILSAGHKGVWGFSPPGFETWGDMADAGVTWGDDESEVAFLRVFASPADHNLWDLAEPTWGQPINTDPFLGEDYI